MNSKWVKWLIFFCWVCVLVAANELTYWLYDVDWIMAKESHLDMLTTFWFAFGAGSVMLFNRLYEPKQGNNKKSK